MAVGVALSADVIVGAHVSTRGGVHNAISKALSIGADAFQIHPTSAQQWRMLELDTDGRATYRQLYVESGLRGQWLHAKYLVNLATPDPVLLRRSVESLVHHMVLAGDLGADGLVLHPGSHRGNGFDAAVGQIGSALREVLDRAGDAGTHLLVENSAGSGGCVGCSLEEVGRIIGAAASPRVRVCLDTQHLFASGYDVRSPETVAVTLDRFACDVGFEHLALVHANDSRRPLGSNADRHANIGEGEIGLDGFRALLADARLRAVPWILEVPGDGDGPDLANVNRLRGCAGLLLRAGGG